MSRRSSGSGKVSLAIDFRAQKEQSHSQDTAHWERLGDVLALVEALEELVGADLEVFLDFGVLTIKDVDLATIRKRREGLATQNEQEQRAVNRRHPMCGVAVQPAEPDPDVMKECPDCGRSFVGIGGLNVHRTRAHPENACAEGGCEVVPEAGRKRCPVHTVLDQERARNGAAMAL